MRTCGDKSRWLLALVLFCAACGASGEPGPLIAYDTTTGWPEVTDMLNEIGGASDVSETLEEARLGCIDDSECEALDDGDRCNGLVLCLAGECQLAPDTVILCSPWENPCAGELCVPETGLCVETQAPPGTDCDDGDTCTTKERCLDGICSGLEFMDCDDQNPCTADNCQEGTCINEAVEVSCEDGNPCTAGDQCAEGECIPGNQQLNCNDENPCTDDACSSVEGCIHQANKKACEDGDPCTLGDQCSGSQCITGPGILNCDDNNNCTNESCIPMEGCVVAVNPVACDDEDPCTTDECDMASGECSHVPMVCDNLCLTPTPVGTECGCLPKVCDDDNFCTVESCQPDIGCLFKADPSICDDENPCTVDTCLAETSTCGHMAVPCEDDNPCTADTCDPLSGKCIFDGLLLQGTSCSDEDECTEPDLCIDGECASGPDVCNEICANKIDDNGDGAIDCADPQCLDAQNCQEQECLVTSTLQCGFVALSSLPGEGIGNLDSYPCSPYAYPAVERVYSFVSPCTGQVSFTVSMGMMGNMTKFLDILALDQESGCKPSSCLAAGLMTGEFMKQAKVTFQATQGKTYYLAVEGRDGDVANFTMTSLCSCIGGGN